MKGKRLEAAETATEKEKKGENNMKVRRVVTGYNADGIAVVKSDELLTGVARFGGIAGVELWSTDQMPVDNSPAADAAQRAGFVKHILPNYVVTGRVTTVRINKYTPATQQLPH